VAAARVGLGFYGLGDFRFVKKKKNGFVRRAVYGGRRVAFTVLGRRKPSDGHVDLIACTVRARAAGLVPVRFTRICRRPSDNGACSGTECFV